MQVLRGCTGYKQAVAGRYCPSLLHSVAVGVLVWLLASSAPRRIARLLPACALKDAEYVVVQVRLPHSACRLLADCER